MMTILAASTQHAIGLFVAGFIVVGWLVYVVVNLRHRDETAPPGSEIELAPNRRPLYNDEILEGRRLEQALGWGLVVMIVCAAGPLFYWLREPGRQAGAENGFEERAVERGRGLFQPTDSPEHGAHFGCATCHGAKGGGGATKYTIEDYLGRSRQVQWACPPVDTALLKFSKSEVRRILEYGRQNTPMPAWGVKGGGPMNDQQLDDLVAYLESITITSDKAKERALADAISEAEKLGKARDPLVPAINVEGEAVFNTNCARCHTKGWSFGEPEVLAGGAFGPNLTNGTALRQFPNPEDQIEFITQGSEYGKPYGERGVGGDEGGGMPGFGQVLSEGQIRAVVDYVRSL